MLILIVVLAIAVVFGFLCAKFIINRKSNSEKFKNMLKTIFILFAVVEFCCAFPILSHIKGLEILRIVTLVFVCGAVGKGFGLIFPYIRPLKAYGIFILLCVFGLVCRYFLEFGEVSNTYNFTLFNIVSYLVLVPAICIAFHQVKADYME